MEVSKKERDMEMLQQKMAQADRESQMALKQREQSSEEELDRILTDKVG